MTSLDKIRAIVVEELAPMNRKLQEGGRDILTKVLEKGVVPGETCKYIKGQIKHLFGTGKNARNALMILANIKDRISADSVQAGLNDENNRRSATSMGKEILHGYEVIEKNGRGVVYLGSARTKPGNEYYEAARELGREVFLLLGSTSWTGAGPGQMEAPLIGAKEAGGKVAGIKIVLDNTQSSFEQSISPVLEPANVAECKYFGPRKVGLADAAMRRKPEDRTAIIATQGGFGTRDEFYEYLVLKQLRKLGTNHEVPIILYNQSGCFDALEADIKAMVEGGMISEHELKLFAVKNNIPEILDYLADFYEIPEEGRGYKERQFAY